MEVARITEVLRQPSPGTEPLGVAFVEETLWIASREAHGLYAMNPATWTVTEEVRAPGAPFGIAVAGDDFRVVIGVGDDDDDRYIYRFSRGRGFESERIECPDLSGAHVAFDGETLLLSQAHNRRIVSLRDDGNVIRSVRLDRRPLGMTRLDGSMYLVSGDENFRNLQLGILNAESEAPRITSLASIPFAARGLAHDGSRFLTCDRATNEVVAFTISEGRRNPMRR